MQLDTEIIRRLGGIEQGQNDIRDYLKKLNGSVIRNRLSIDDIRIRDSRREGQLSVIKWLLIAILIPILLPGAQKVFWSDTSTKAYDGEVHEASTL